MKSVAISHSSFIFENRKILNTILPDACQRYGTYFLTQAYFYFIFLSQVPSRKNLLRGYFNIVLHKCQRSRDKLKRYKSSADYLGIISI